MQTEISRRDMIRARGLGAAALAAAELGDRHPAWAEDAFTIASTGGSCAEPSQEFSDDVLGLEVLEVACGQTQPLGIDRGIVLAEQR